MSDEPIIKSVLNADSDLTLVGSNVAVLTVTTNVESVFNQVDTDVVDPIDITGDSINEEIPTLYSTTKDGNCIFPNIVCDPVKAQVNKPDIHTSDAKINRHEAMSTEVICDKTCVVNQICDDSERENNGD